MPTVTAFNLNFRRRERTGQTGISNAVRNVIFRVGVVGFGIVLVMRQHRYRPRRVQARREKSNRRNKLARRIPVADKSLLEGVGTFDATFRAFTERRQFRLVEFVVDFFRD